MQTDTMSNNQFSSSPVTNDVTVRLSSLVIESIRSVFETVFDKGDLYLFGSRVDQSQRGGDIDLLLVPECFHNITEKKINFLIKLKRLIGDQKIDLVIDRGQNRAIDKIAKGTGVLLCQKH